MKRIGIDLLVITKKYAGAGRYGLCLVNALQKADKINKYFLFLNKDISNKIVLNNRNFTKVIISIPCNLKIFRVIYEQFFLRFTVRKYSLDVMHFISNIAPIMNKIDKDISTVLTVHDLIFIKNSSRYPVLKYLYYRIFIDKSIAIADKIITVSKTIKNDILLLRKKDIQAIYSAAGRSFEFLNLKKENWILIFSTIEPGKNIEFVIKSIKEYKIKIVVRQG